MGYAVGKLKRKTGKTFKEYYVGEFANVPLRAAWGKNGQDILYLFLDDQKIAYLAQKNKASAEGQVQTESQVNTGTQQQPV